MWEPAWNGDVHIVNTGNDWNGDVHVAIIDDVDIVTPVYTMSGMDK